MTLIAKELTYTDKEIETSWLH